MKRRGITIGLGLVDPPRRRRSFRGVDDTPPWPIGNAIGKDLVGTFHLKRNLFQPIDRHGDPMKALRAWAAMSDCDVLEVDAHTLEVHRIGHARWTDDD